MPAAFRAICAWLCSGDYSSFVYLWVDQIETGRDMPATDICGARKYALTAATQNCQLPPHAGASGCTEQETQAGNQLVLDVCSATPPPSCHEDQSCPDPDSPDDPDEYGHVEVRLAMV